MEPKLEKAVIRFLIDEPFFSKFMIGRLKEDSEIPLMATDMAYIYYNPSSIDVLTMEEIKGVLLHEILHIVWKHGLRKESRNHVKWNIACDYVINLEVRDHGYSLPDGVFWDEKYRGMTAEKVYDLLPDSITQSVGMLGGDLMESDLTPEEMKELSQRITQEIVVAAQIAKMAGKDSSHLQDLIFDSVAPKVDWVSYLNQFANSVDKSDYSWERRNRRYSGNFYLPALYKKVLGKIIWGVDTSGSINKELLSKMIAEMNSVKDRIGADVTILYCDTKICGEDTFEHGEPMTFNPKGGGGTMYSPVMEWIKESQEVPECLIYLTDGWCDDFGEDPDVPVLWTVYENKKFDPPFGEVIFVE